MGSLWEEGLFIGVPGEISKGLSRNGLTSAFFFNFFACPLSKSSSKCFALEDCGMHIQNIDTYT